MLTLNEDIVIIITIIPPSTFTMFKLLPIYYLDVTTTL